MLGLEGHLESGSELRLGNSKLKWMYVYIMDYYSAIKKNERMQFVVTWMDLEITILSEVSRTEKDKSHDITYIWN